MTYTGAGGNIEGVFVHNGSLYGASKDNTVRQWDAIKGNLIRIYLGSSETIECVHGTEDVIFACGGSGSLFQLNATSGQLVNRVTEMHPSAMESLFVHKNWVFTGGGDTRLGRYNYLTDERAYFSGHTGAIRGIFVNDDFVFTAGRDRSMRQWTHQGQLIRTYLDHATNVQCVFGIGPYVLTSSDDMRVYIYRYATQNIVFEMNTGHTYPVRSITVFGEWLFTGSADNTIRQWLIPGINTPLNSITPQPTNTMGLNLLDAVDGATGAIETRSTISNSITGFGSEPQVQTMNVVLVYSIGIVLIVPAVAFVIYTRRLMDPEKDETIHRSNFYPHSI